MNTQITTAENLRLTEALSSLYGTVLLAAKKRRSQFSRHGRVIRSANRSDASAMEQLELGLAMDAKD